MRSRFDQFAKQMVRAGLSAGGAVHTDEEVSPDARRIDIWFTPAGDGVERALRPPGLLGRIGLAACTMEPFHQTPRGLDVMDCVCKHHLFRGVLSRREPQTPLPVQWIISSGRPEGALAGLKFEASAEWGQGVHQGPALTHTRLVVVSELPRTRDTLLVRLLGSGQVLLRAIAELHALPADAPERSLALPFLLGLRLEIPKDPTQRTEDETEFVMTTEQLVENYLQEQRRAGREEGLEKGVQVGVRGSVTDAFTARFGTPPDDVVAILSRTEDVALLRSWLKLVVGAPMQDALAAIRSGTAPR